MLLKSFEKAKAAGLALVAEQEHHDRTNADVGLEDPGVLPFDWSEKDDNEDGSVIPGISVNTDNSTHSERSAQIEAEPRIKQLVRAMAPSFQATSLGPALFLAEQDSSLLPIVDHSEWLDAISSGDAANLVALLDRAGMGQPAGPAERSSEAREAHPDDNGDDDLEDLDFGFDDGDADGDDPAYAPRPDETQDEFFNRISKLQARDEPPSRLTCEKIAQRVAQTCPVPSSSSFETGGHDGIPETSLTRRSGYGRLRKRRSGIRHEPLPYDLFPPGMRFFARSGAGSDGDAGVDTGSRACVVHANYATGGDKARLLRSRGLWALVEDRTTDGEIRYMCDADVLVKA